MRKAANVFNETAYDLALSVGCPPDGARIAAAIAQAESSGNARAYNPETAASTPQGQGSYGLWQIYRKAHPEFNGQDLYNPNVNAAAMYAVSGGCRNWAPWSTFKNGAYRAYLQSGSTGGTVAPSGSQGDDSGDGDTGSWLPGVETLTSPIDLFSGAPVWLGIAALLAGAYFLLR